MYGQTWDDLAVTPAPLAWQMIRSLRHEPPGRAVRGDRKATFGAALEQAEQFFAAAGVVGPATRPVLIFYGLSQAGRAVAAAATSAGQNDWRLDGHGITTSPLQDAQRGSLADLTLRDDGRGSFTQLAAILDAASLPNPTLIGQLWCLLPDVARHPLPGMGKARPLVVDREPATTMRGSRALVRVSPLPARLAHRPPPGQNHSVGQEEGWRAERQRIGAFLADYPTLAGWDFNSPEDHPVGLTYVLPDAVQVPVRLGRADSSQLEAENIAARTTGYRAQRYAFPTVGGSLSPAHPFLLWWALTFGLSMLARYEPKAWAERISITSSADASPVEHLPNQAIATLPELIHRTIMEAAQAP